MKTHYDVLNVTPNAPLYVIRSAYKSLCQNFHPDKVTGNIELAHQLIKRINSAYTVLSDPDKRAEYDKLIFGKEIQALKASVYDQSKELNSAYNTEKSSKNPISNFYLSQHQRKKFNSWKA